MNYLSICSIVKNEELYLRDCVEFHLEQGFEHFYLYDNSDNDRQKKSVADLPGITWHDLPGQAMQRTACDHCIANHTKDTVWCLFCDVDEYVYSGNSGMFSTTFKNEYDLDGISAVAVHWLLFGSSGHLEYSPEPVTKRFTRRAAEVNPHVKSIVRMSDAHCMGSNVHSFRVKGSIIDETFRELPTEYAISTPATADVLRCNHYVTKSKAECDKRRSAPRADTGEMRSNDFFVAHDCNDVEDRRILDVI